MNQFIQNKEGAWEKAIDFFKRGIKNLRTGRANPAILDGVVVEAYGVKTPLNGLSTINVVDGQTLVVSPWDKNVIKDIEKAIVEAQLGLGVINEGDRIRLTVPRMTEENRREMVKKLNGKMEEARIAIRQIREEVKEEIEEAEKNKEISEDDKFRFIKELDEKVNELNQKLKEIRDKKEEEIMTI
jgi:ribosome recycling factor